MTAKKYLQQIKTLDIKINQKQQQYQDLKSAASTVSAILYDKEPVSTSKTDNKFQRLTDQYIDLEKEIAAEELELQKLKEKIINQIQQLHDDQFVEILYKKYVEYKSFELIAVEMDYTIRNIYIIHSKALKNFSQNFTCFQGEGVI